MGCAQACPERRSIYGSRMHEHPCSRATGGGRPKDQAPSNTERMGVAARALILCGRPLTPARGASSQIAEVAEEADIHIVTVHVSTEKELLWSRIQGDSSPPPRHACHTHTYSTRHTPHATRARFNVRTASRRSAERLVLEPVRGKYNEGSRDWFEKCYNFYHRSAPCPAGQAWPIDGHWPVQRMAWRDLGLLYKLSTPVSPPPFCGAN